MFFFHPLVIPSKVETKIHRIVFTPLGNDLVEYPEGNLP
jgi:hypothetical protein